MQPELIIWEYFPKILFLIPVCMQYLLDFWHA
jgi:hypothetical protein